NVQISLRAPGSQVACAPHAGHACLSSAGTSAMGTEVIRNRAGRIGGKPRPARADVYFGPARARREGKMPNRRSAIRGLGIGWAILLAGAAHARVLTFEER